jgi:DMSO/TMAO reductase YedYZ molybdopterin-dependent catalytic subunit
MAVPWSGFPLKSLVDLAVPQSGAKYLRFETFNNPDVAPGLGAAWYPWPYIEGLTMEEATNELAFMVTGMYGKPVPKQNGAPLRLATPWKYGFKSAKGIVKITFTDQQPKNFWQSLQDSEYGPLEPGRRAGARPGRHRADPAVQRLWRVRGIALQRHAGPRRRALPVATRRNAGSPDIRLAQCGIRQKADPTHPCCSFTTLKRKMPGPRARQVKQGGFTSGRRRIRRPHLGLAPRSDLRLPT